MELDLNTIEALFDDLKTMGTKNVYIEGGGEPLLYRNINEIIEWLYNHKINGGLFTNGLELPKIEHILPRLKWIRISLDASSSTAYSVLKNCPTNNFFKVLNNIGKIIEIRGKSPDPQIGISFVVTEKNFKEIGTPIYKLASKIGADYFSIIPDYNMERNKREYVYKTVLENMEKNSYFEDFISSNSRSFEFVIRNIYSKCKSSKCYYSNCTSCITASGDVFPCSWLSYNYKYRMGSIKERSFISIWNSKKYKNLRNNLNPYLCPPCGGRLLNNLIQSYIDKTPIKVDETLFYML